MPVFTPTIWTDVAGRKMLRVRRDRSISVESIVELYGTKQSGKDKCEICQNNGAKVEFPITYDELRAILVNKE